MIIRSDNVVASIYRDIRQQVFTRPPCLAVVQIAGDKASDRYVAAKQRAALDLGFQFRHVLLPADTTSTQLSAKVRELNHDNTVDGFIVQKPLPCRFDDKEITPSKDVDGLHPENLGRLWAADLSGSLSCTPLGVYTWLKQEIIPAHLPSSRQRRALIVGRSNLVGKPMAAFLIYLDFTVTMAHSRSDPEWIQQSIRESDLIVSAVGKPGWLAANTGKQGSVFVDIGINVGASGKLVGDINSSQVSGQVVTAVPGGVGPLTVACLMMNVAKAHKENK